MIYNFDFRKSLGQNFLIDDSIVDNIANAIDYKENNMIIEIGPGSGNLTKKLLKKADFVLLYEIDTRLKKILSRELLEFNNYDIIWDDFLYRDVKEDLKKYNYKNIYIVANLPYYITTPIVSKFVMETIPANEIVIMIQKEVAERLSAPVGTKEYGQITVLLNYHFNIEKIIDVDRKAFYPTPNVDSAVIKMIRKDNLEDLTSFEHFDKLVKDSFQFKRKTIKNNLINKYVLGDTNKTFYEINTLKHKHHLVCTSCKKIFPLENCPLSKYESELEDNLDFEITGHKLEIYGICKECRKH